MYLGVDGRFMTVHGGLGRYTREILFHLARQNPSDHFTVLIKPGTENLPPFHNIEYIETDIHWYGVAEQIKLGLVMNRMKRVETWFIPHWNVPLFLFAPFVMTIHDFIFEEFPTHGPRLIDKIKFFFKWVVWRILLGLNVSRTKGIIAVSEFVKTGVVTRFPWAAHKTTVVYNGVSIIHPQETHTPVHENFFMMVGNSYPHKNHELVLRAYELHPEFTTPTIIFTHQDRFSEALTENIAARNLSSRIQVVFDPSDEVLSAHYSHATALIFPSRAEGFGIPPLEAFSCGTAAIVAKTSVMPELLDNLPLWISPDSPEELFSALLTAQQNKKNELESVREARRVCAKKFQWQNSALSTRNFIQKMLY